MRRIESSSDGKVEFSENLSSNLEMSVDDVGDEVNATALRLVETLDQ